MNKMNILAFLALSLLMVGCASYDKSIYLRGDGELQQMANGKELFEYRVMPKDELTITVSTSDPEVSSPFYRKIGQAKNQSTPGQGFDNAKLLDYLVDNAGFIDFPVLGKSRWKDLPPGNVRHLYRKNSWTI